MSSGDQGRYHVPVHTCDECGAAHASWDSMLPRGWVGDPITGRIFCGRCREVARMERAARGYPEGRP